MNRKLLRTISVFFFIGSLLVSTKDYAQVRISSQTREKQRLALQYERLGDYDQARRIYEELYQKRPTDYMAFDGLKRILLVQKKYDEAIELYTDRITHRYDLRMHAELGAVYYMKGDQKKAQEIWNMVLKKNKMRSHAYQFVARAMMQNRLFDQAKSIYRQARKTLKDKHLFTIELANLYTVQNDYKQAAGEYLNYLKKNPKQYTFTKINFTRFISKDPEVADILIKILKKQSQENPDLINFRKLLVDVYLTVSDYENAFQEIVMVDELAARTGKSKDLGRQLFDFGNTVLKEGNYAFAEQAFTLLLERHPKSSFADQAHYGMARSLQLQNNHAGALAAYEALIKNNNHSYQAQEALFQIGDVKLYQQDDPGGARDAYQKILTFYRRGKKRFQASFKIGDCYFAEGNLAQAREWYTRPLKEKKISTQTKIVALYNLAQIDLVENQLDDAKKRLDEIIEQNTGSSKPEELLLVNDALDLSLLLEENQNNPNSFQLYNQTILLQRQRKYDQAVMVLDSLIAAFPDDPIIDETFIKQAELFVLLDEYQNAIQRYRQLIAKQPESFHCDFARMKIGLIFETKLSDYPQAIQEYEEFLTQYPKSMYLESVRQRLRRLERNL